MRSETTIARRKDCGDFARVRSIGEWGATDYLSVATRTQP
jgi:hypothetical protein